MASPPTCDSAVSPCFHGCLAFLHRHFPPWSAPSHPLNLSLHSQQQPSAWDNSTISELCIPVRGMYGLGKDCLILIPFRLPQISCFTLSLKHFSSVSDNCPDVEIGLLPAEGRSSPVNTPVFPPSSFILPSFAWFNILFSSGEVLLSTLIWCSGCTCV